MLIHLIWSSNLPFLLMNIITQFVLPRELKHKQHEPLACPFTGLYATQVAKLSTDASKTPGAFT